jgi:hypothetical protein
MEIYVWELLYINSHCMQKILQGGIKSEERGAGPTCPHLWAPEKPVMATKEPSSMHGREGTWALIFQVEMRG